MAMKAVATLAAAILLSAGIASGRNEFAIDYSSSTWSVHFINPEIPTKTITLKSTDFQCEQIAKGIYKYTHPSAVVVWNTSSTDAASYKLKFKGHKAKSVDSPEGSATPGTIAPDSVQIIIY